MILSDRIKALRVSGKKRRKALRRINAMGLEESPDDIGGAFIWNATPEGRKFWLRLERLDKAQRINDLA